MLVRLFLQTFKLNQPCIVSLYDMKWASHDLWLTPDREKHGLSLFDSSPWGASHSLLSWMAWRMWLKTYHLIFNNIGSSAHQKSNFITLILRSLTLHRENKIVMKLFLKHRQQMWIKVICFWLPHLDVCMSRERTAGCRIKIRKGHKNVWRQLVQVYWSSELPGD